MKTWSKTLLSVYKYLEALSNAIDKLVIKKSISSAFYSNGRNNSCYDTANKIMQLTERKVNLINLKVLVEDVLEKMPLQYKQIITLSYVDNVHSEEIANMMGISMRTFFRKKSEALDSFASTLSSLGYSAKRLETLFYGETWLNQLYKRNLQNEMLSYNDDDFNTNRFFKSVVREFNMV